MGTIGGINESGGKGGRKERGEGRWEKNVWVIRGVQDVVEVGYEQLV